MHRLATIVLSVSVVAWGRPQYIEPEEIPGHLDDAYQFAYAVASPEHGDYHGHQQSRDERGFTSGSYYLLGADGQWSQTIFADKGSGYQALYNQRPAGAPPPQVSEVSYQIFVHPGATAISAQGGVGAPTKREVPLQAPAPLQPFGGIQQNNLPKQIQVVQPSPRFNRDTLVSESAATPTVVAPELNSNVIVAKVTPDELQRNVRQVVPDQLGSPSVKTNLVMVPVGALPPRQRQPKSIFTTSISSLLRRFQPKPMIPRN